MFNDYDEILTINDLCNILNIGKTAAYKLLRSGDIKCWKIGRNWKVSKKAVEKYILEKS